METLNVMFLGTEPSGIKSFILELLDLQASYINSCILHLDLLDLHDSYINSFALHLHQQLQASYITSFILHLNLLDLQASYINSFILHLDLLDLHDSNINSFALHLNRLDLQESERGLTGVQVLLHMIRMPFVLPRLCTLLRLHQSRPY
jgi:hypothetical protein